MSQHPLVQRLLRDGEHFMLSISVGIEEEATELHLNYSRVDGELEL